PGDAGRQPPRLARGPRPPDGEVETRRTVLAARRARRPADDPPEAAEGAGQLGGDPRPGAGGGPSDRRGPAVAGAATVILAFVEHDRGTVEEGSFEALTLGRR